LEESAPPYVFLHACSLSVDTVRFESEIVTHEGVLRPTQKDCRFLVVRADGRFPAAGTLVWHPSIFGLIYQSDGKSFTVSSRAVGIQGRNDNNEIVESWTVAGERNAVTRITSAEGFALHLLVAFEVPKNIGGFEVFVPAPIPKDSRCETTTIRRAGSSSAKIHGPVWRNSCPGLSGGADLSCVWSRSPG